MENEYNLPEETNENQAEEPALGYKTATSKVRLPEYSPAQLQMQAEQAIKDFENGLCISHEKMKKK